MAALPHTSALHSDSNPRGLEAPKDDGQAATTALGSATALLPSLQGLGIKAGTACHNLEKVKISKYTKLHEEGVFPS